MFKITISLALPNQQANPSCHSKCFPITLLQLVVFIALYCGNACLFGKFFASFRFWHFVTATEVDRERVTEQRQQQRKTKQAQHTMALFVSIHVRAFRSFM